MGGKILSLNIILLGLVWIMMVPPAIGKIRVNRDVQGGWQISNLELENNTEAREASVAAAAPQKTSLPANRTVPAPKPQNIYCFTGPDGVIRISNIAPSTTRQGQEARREQGSRLDRASAVQPAGGQQKPISVPQEVPVQVAGHALPASSQSVTPEEKPAASISSPQGRRYGKIYLARDRQGRYLVYNIKDDAPTAKPSLAASRALEPVIKMVANQYRLEPALIKAVIKAESNFHASALSPKGAIGLMQLMPETAGLLGVSNPWSPAENILGGSRYLRWLLDYFHGDLELALAAYNAGSQRVIRAGLQVPGIKETKDFVRNVLRHLEQYQQTQSESLDKGSAE